ncbi:hypothetical protein ILYODFUR_026371 [Ilyodon furcidens]|uniref:Uncharacterized protein n=1 Tax=Ilyodon furcidens TaxID=33524 RepID=A0ABV0UVC7_9TELE
MIYYVSSLAESIKFHHSLLKNNGRLMIIVEAEVFLEPLLTLLQVFLIVGLLCVPGRSILEPATSHLLPECFAHVNL